MKSRQGIDARLRHLEVQARAAREDPYPKLTELIVELPDGHGGVRYERYDLVNGYMKGASDEHKNAIE